MKNSINTQPFAIPPFEDGDRVAFFGDSITRNGEGITRTAAYYRSTFPERKVRFFNVGISGGTVSAAHIFFEDWLAPLRPTHVILAFGVNDAALAIVTGKTTDIKEEKRKADDAVAHFESEYERLISRIKNIGATVVLRTPTPYDESVSGKDFSELGRGAAQRRIADSVRRIAHSHSLPLVDDYTCFSTQLISGEKLFNDDHIHPNERGQWRLAENFLSAQGLAADDFQPFAEVAAEAGLAAWHEAAVSLTIIPSTEWLILHGEALPADEKLEKVKKWLDVNEGKKDAHPVIVRFAHEYLCNKPREAELRAKENSFAMNTETVNMSLRSQGQK